MEIKYEIIPEDLTYYSKEAATGTPMYTVYALFIVAFTVLFMLSDMMLAVIAVFKNDGTIKVDSFHMLPRLIIALAISGISYVVLMTVSKRAARKARANAGKNGFFCEHTITLAEDGFTESTHVNRNFTSWEAVEKVSETKNYVLIDVRLSSRYFIPKSAFPSPDDMRTFVETVQTHIHEANVPPQPPATN